MAFGIGGGGLSVSVEDREVRELFRALGRRTSDLSPVFRQIDRTVGVFFREQFETSGKVGGKPWAPLTEATKRYRTGNKFTSAGRLRKKRSRPGGNRGGVDRPLWDTARGKRSLQTVGPESIRVIQPQRYERGSRVPYLVHHQRGATLRQWGGVAFKTPKKLPAREIVPDPLPRILTDRWLDVVARYIERGVVTP